MNARKIREIRQKIQARLKEHRNTVTWLANQIGVHRVTLYRKLSQAPGYYRWQNKELEAIEKILGVDLRD